jgi:predicted phage tail component-like protein
MSSVIKSFAGVITPAFFLVEKVTFSVLPPSQITQLDIPLTSGAYFINQKHGVRTFAVDYTIKAANSSSVMYAADDLAVWLNHKTPQPLVFRDKPDQTYYAIVDGATDLSKFGQSGKGQLTFVCLDPHAYGLERTYSFNPLTTDPIIVFNNGNQKTGSEMEMTFTKNVTDFAIVTDTDMLYFGEPFDATVKTPTNLKPRVLSDGLDSTSGWTEGITVDGGVVAGTLVSNGYSFSQFEKNYGVGSGWHGGSMIKSLGKQVQDFTCEATIGLIASDKKQVGRVEVYLLDINGNKLGKIALVDFTATGEFPKFEARAGGGGGHYLVSDYGNKPYTFADFSGMIRISRIGKKWEAYVGKIDSKGKHHTRMSKTWTDSKNLYGTKVAAVQIHVGTQGVQVPTNSMHVSSIVVYEHLEKTPVVVNYVFEKDDILTIDNSTGEVRKNGEPCYQDLYPSSSFLMFENGANGVSVSEPAITNGKITFKERWL